MTALTVSMERGTKQNKKGWGFREKEVGQWRSAGIIYVGKFQQVIHGSDDLKLCSEASLESGAGL